MVYLQAVNFFYAPLYEGIMLQRNGKGKMLILPTPGV
jgi:hypothetical protein